jgi:hypothetical protein
MKNSKLSKIKQMSRLVNKDKTEMAHDFVSTIQKKLAERKYRADLLLITGAKCTTGTFSAQVKFSAPLGYPAENDIIAIVAQNYPQHQVCWELVQVDPDAGIVSLTLEPSVEIIPVESLTKIPPEFTPIGSALFKRSANKAGTINEIWTLKKDSDGGLSLYRSQDDLEITADDDGGFKKGDVVDTPQGPGIIQSFDSLNNAYVKIGSEIRLIGSVDLKSFDISKEKTKLYDYYAQVYGPEFAKELTSDFGEAVVEDKRKNPKTK